jgi:thiol-disulfide isomerase/thioredoxin
MAKNIAKKAEHVHEEHAKPETKQSFKITPITVIALVAVIAASVFAGTLIAQPAAASCGTTSDAGVCAVNNGLTVKLDPVLSCGNASCSAPEGKVSVIAFYSPTCPYCEAQYTVFQQLKQLYGEQLDVKYACRNVHTGDDTLCQQNNESKYLDWETSQKLASQYGADEKGTPVVIFNCKYQRYGSLALQNETLEYNELKSIIDGLL